MTLVFPETPPKLPKPSKTMNEITNTKSSSKNNEIKTMRTETEREELSKKKSNVINFKGKTYEILNDVQKDVFFYNERYCCCCTKKVKCVLVVTEIRLFFFGDSTFEKLIRVIDIDNIISINKRQLTIEDLFSLSIFYKENESDKVIKEFKIKCSKKNKIS